MPSELIKCNLDLLLPELVTPLLETLAECKAKGKLYVAYSGRRSFKDQQTLWCQGRTKTRDEKGNRLPIVTNAQAGFSMHNYGLAVDCYLDDHLKDGLQPVWSNDNGEYALLKEVAEKWGFKVGVPSVPGGDPGHLQVPVMRLYDVEKEAKLLGGWKALVKRVGEDKAVRSIWEDVGRVWPVDERTRVAPPK